MKIIQQFCAVSFILIFFYGGVHAQEKKDLKVMSGKGWNILSDIVCDNDNNIWTCIGFEDSISSDNNTYASKGDRDVLISKYSDKGELLFTKKIEGTDYQSVHSLVTDTKNNLWLTGHFRGTLYADNIVITAYEFLENFIACYDKRGKLLFINSFKTECEGNKMCIVSDKKGQIYWGASFSGAMINGNETFFSHGGTDIIIRKLNKKGEFESCKQIGGIGNDQLSDIKIDDQNNIIITGSFEDKIGEAGLSLTSYGLNDFFYVKLNSVFTVLNYGQGGGTGRDMGEGIVLLDDNSFVIGGSFEETFRIENDSTESRGFRDIFTIRFDKNGKFIQLKTHGYTGADEITSMVALGDKIYFTGHYLSQFNSGSQIVESNDPMGDLFLCTLDKHCNTTELTSYGGNNREWADKITIWKDETLILAGNFSFGFKAGTDSIQTKHRDDLFIVQYSVSNFKKTISKRDTIITKDGIIEAREGYTRWNTCVAGQYMQVVNSSGQNISETTNENDYRQIDTIDVSIADAHVFVRKKSPDFDRTNLMAEENETSFFTIYPNPTSGVIHIRLSPQTIQYPLSVQIYSEQGCIIFNNTINENQKDISFYIEYKGIYFLIINEKVKKIVVE